MVFEQRSLQARHRVLCAPFLTMRLISEELRSGTFELILPRPTPLFFRLNTALVPPANLPASTCWIVE